MSWRSSGLAFEHMSDLRTDEDFLREALDLARRGIGLTAPNPNVGAVIVTKAAKLSAPARTPTTA